MHRRIARLGAGHFTDRHCAGAHTWPHLIANVLPGAVRRTLALMEGVAGLTLLIGTGTAWLVTMYRFHGRSLCQWLLLLPLAIPAYIIAFCYLELFDYSGALQTGLRQLFGWHSAKDYWFPDIRSVGGAIFVMSMVLYPYVYITARASFLAQSVCVLDVSRTLGRSAAATFREVALPLARPALAAGLALALMETLNDIGAIKFLGARTLTVAVYDTWLDRNSLAGAAQIACVMLAFVFAVLLIERAMRAKRRYHHTTGRYRHLPEDRLPGAAGLFATLACALPILFGFVLPASVLIHDSRPGTGVLGGRFAQSDAVGGRGLSRRGLRRDTWLCAPADAVEADPHVERRPGHQLRGARHRARHRPAHPLARLDNGVDAAMRSLFEMPTGLLLSGSAFAIVLAYTIRFLAASLGAVEAGLSKISRNIEAAARTLGATIGETLWRVHLPLLRPALGTAALLAFVDSMKELPATLLLRPFNFDTLATQVFTLASLYRYEEAGLSALSIVVVSLVRVLLLHGIIVAGRPGALASQRSAASVKGIREAPRPLDKSIKSGGGLAISGQ